MSNAVAPMSPRELAVFAWPEQPSVRETILQFFAAEISNVHTRRAYMAAASEFLYYASGTASVSRLETLTPLHVAGWMEAMKRTGLSIPTIKGRLAALRRLFQYLIQQGALRTNPAAAVRGPKHSVRRGKTPVLAPDEAKQLLFAIDTETLSGLRDRAIIATMIYSFARISAVTSLKVEDVFVQQRRLWLRLHEKGGKCVDIPCHHNLETYLSEYLAKSGLGGASGQPLFQTLNSCRDALTGRALSQPLAWSMVQRRIRDAGIGTAACNHTFRATGITAYLKNGGTLERAAAMANHASTRTTQLYDRRPDDITLDEIEKIRI